MAKSKTPVVYTPRGIAVFPWLNRPDTKQFNDGDSKPKYKVKLRFNPEDPQWAKFMADMQAILDEKRAEYAKENPKHSKLLTTKYAAFRPVADDEGNLTGEMEMTVTMNASYTDKQTKKTIELKPAFVDGKNKKIENGKVPAIYGGSVLRLGVKPGLMGTGKEITESWQLVGVQIIQLAERTGGLDFGAADDGYEYEDEAEGDFPAEGAAEPDEVNTDKPEDF